MSAMLRIAHRGGASLAPENTLAAFRRALTFPIDAVELDVQMSRDGQVIVFHDHHVERLTDGRGNLLDLDFAYIRTLNAAAHFPGGWPEPEPVPTLREVLQVIQNRDRVLACIEIKPSKRGHAYGRYPRIAEEVVAELHAADMLERALVISFDWDLLPAVKRLAPTIQTGALVSDEVWDSQAGQSLDLLIEQVKSLGCDWVDLDEALFLPEMPALMQRHQLKLGLWTVNDEPSLQRLAAAGVDALTSDRPDLFALLAG